MAAAAATRSRRPRSASLARFSAGASAHGSVGQVARGVGAPPGMEGTVGCRAPELTAGDDRCVHGGRAVPAVPDLLCVAADKRSFPLEEEGVAANGAAGGEFEPVEPPPFRLTTGGDIAFFPTIKVDGLQAHVKKHMKNSQR